MKLLVDEFGSWTRQFEKERPSRPVADLMQADKMQSNIYSVQTIKPSS